MKNYIILFAFAVAMVVIATPAAGQVFNTGNTQFLRSWEMAGEAGLGFNPSPTATSAVGLTVPGFTANLRMMPGGSQQRRVAALPFATLGLQVPFNNRKHYLGGTASLGGMIGNETFRAGLEARGYLGRIEITPDSMGVILPDLEKSTLYSVYVGATAEIWLTTIFRNIPVYATATFGRQIEPNGSAWQGGLAVVIRGGVPPNLFRRR